MVDGCFVIAATYAGCDALVVGIFFAVSVGATGLQTSSLYVNAIDLSPNYSGTICGFSSTFGALAGTLGPALVGFLTPNVSRSSSTNYPNQTYMYIFDLNLMFTFEYCSHCDLNGASFSGSISVCTWWRLLCSQRGVQLKSNHGMIHSRSTINPSAGRSMLKAPKNRCGCDNKYTQSNWTLVIHSVMFKMLDLSFRIFFDRILNKDNHILIHLCSVYSIHGTHSAVLFVVNFYHNRFTPEPDITNRLNTHSMIKQRIIQFAVY